MRRTRGMIAGIVLLAVAAACGDDSGAAGDGDVRDDIPDGEVVVFAAASLTEVFDEIGDAFEDAYPGVSVTFNYAGSSTLAEQINQGAPADVFASADERIMDLVADEGGVDREPVEFAVNTMEIAVEPGNPLDIGGVADLADPSLDVVLCDTVVPCGSFAAELFELAGVDVEAKSLEEDVKAVLTKVALGEADAGIVYTTDIVAAAGDVDGVRIPSADNVGVSYPIASLSDAPNSEGADAFVGFVTAPEAQRILMRYGFGVPTARRTTSR